MLSIQKNERNSLKILWYSNCINRKRCLPLFQDTIININNANTRMAVGFFRYQRCVWSTGTDLLLHSCQEQCSSSVIPCITFFESWSACQWIERTHQCLLIFHHFLYMNKDNTLPLQENMKNGYHSQWKLKQTSTYENSSAISEILQYSKIIWMLALSSKGKWTSWAHKAPKFISWVNELYQSLW